MIRFCTHVLLGCLVLGLVGPHPASAKSPDPPTYRCQGFDEPLRDGMQIAKGRVLPLRAKLVGPDGSFGDQSSLKTPPAISFHYLPESGPEVDKTGGMEVRDYGKGTHFVWDDEAHWKFDLGTGNLADDGKYRVTLLSGDEAEYKVDPACAVTFNLRSK
jgi:hypothetical protein